MLDRDEDHYRALGVSPEASMSEIRRAYRRLARRHHPDVSHGPGAEDEFVAVAEAYAVLHDPVKRARYDDQLRPPGRARDAGRTPGPPSAGAWVEPRRAHQRQAIVELSRREAELVATAPLTLSDGRGLAIELPAGTRHGDRLRVIGATGGWRDLILTVAIPSHPAQT